MRTFLRRSRGGFTLVELIVAAGLMAILGTSMIQFISIFYQFRLKDAIAEQLLSQSARVQAEYRYYARNATAYQLYSTYLGKSSGVTASGNYCEMTFPDQTQTSVTVGIEMNATTKSLTVYYAPLTDATRKFTACTGAISGPNGGANAFSFDSQVPYLKYALQLPSTGPGATNTETFNVVAYAQPLYMR